MSLFPNQRAYQGRSNTYGILKGAQIRPTLHLYARPTARTVFHALPPASVFLIRDRNWQMSASKLLHLKHADAPKTYKMWAPCVPSWRAVAKSTLHEAC